MFISALFNFSFNFADFLENPRKSLEKLYNILGGSIEKGSLFIFIYLNIFLILSGLL